MSKRKEIFGNMSNREILSELVGGLMFFMFLVGFCFGILLVG